ncbi:transposable element Tcb1 transposase [Trichonephila clavipes]|nr:transposable element Tcb1 transposase [Trichonephila clavipes]
MNSGDGQRNGTTLCLLTNPASACNITIVGFEFVRIAGTENNQRYISEVLETVVLPYIQRRPLVIFQQDNKRPQVARNVQQFFFTHLIELIPRPACSPDLFPMKIVCFMLAQ